MPTSASTILLVDDEESIQTLLTYPLERDGYSVVQARDGEEALRKFDEEAVDLVVLDVMLPRLDGLEVCKRLRSQSNVPIIMLTARGEEIDRIVGLELGADDYVVKPFSAGELVARMRAIMRRGRSTATRKEPITLGPITLDPAARTVTKGDDDVELAAKEFDLLHLLMAHAGEVVKREDIMDEVWDPHWFGPTKTLDVHVSWLRKKIEDDPANPQFITTIRGVGFRFATDDDLA
jgi:DNA-binding response OmpR family regulator